jgi:hypothetical protein
MRLIEDDGYVLALPAKKLSKMQRRALVRFGREVELVDARKLLRGVNARAEAQDLVLSEVFLPSALWRRTIFSPICVFTARIILGRG